MSIELTQEEVRNLAGLIDIALKHPQAGGVAIVGPALALLQKLEQAQRDAHAAEQP